MNTINRTLFSLLALFFIAIPCYGQNFEVKHADKLEIIDEFILIQGDVQIRYKDTFIHADEGQIYSDDKGEPEKAVFNGNVKIDIKDGVITADQSTIEIKTTTIISERNTYSELKDKDGKLIKTYAEYQKFSGEGKGVSAKRNVKTSYEDTMVTADELLVLYKDKKPSEAIFFGINTPAIFEQSSNKTLAKSITFNLNTKQAKASGNVESTIWGDQKIPRAEQDPVFVKADDIYLENDNTFVAKGSEKLVRVDYQETSGKSLIAHLMNDKKEGKPEKIIFEGNAEVEQPDKKLLSEIVEFSFKDKTLTSNTKANIRPKTIIYKKDDAKI